MKSSKSKNRFFLYLRKFRRKLKNLMDSKEEKLSEVQLKAFSITRKLIAHPNSLLVPAPLSGLPSNLKRRTLEPRTLSTTFGNSKSCVKDKTLSGKVILSKKKLHPCG